MSKNFALIGAGGYIAPRHMNAIKKTGNLLTAALDPNDSVGIMDNYFPQADFFTEFERFDRHIDKLRRIPDAAINYISVCSPNYLHDSHIRFALRSNADVICEKPVVLNHWNIDALQHIEKETGRKVNTVLQLRIHPSVIELKKKIDAPGNKKKYDADITYITPRGKWYLNSWKGDMKKSGGIAFNIGIHFFDMLHFLFGKLSVSKVHCMNEHKGAGYIELEKARVRWFLSIDEDDIPVEQKAAGSNSYRSLIINGDKIELSNGFHDLHTGIYQEILKGNGFGLEENRAVVETVAQIRNQTPVGTTGDYHPFLKSNNGLL